MVNRDQGHTPIQRIVVEISDHLVQEDLETTHNEAIINRGYRQYRRNNWDLND